MGYAIDPRVLAMQRAILTGGGRTVLYRSAQNWFFDRPLVTRRVGKLIAEALRWAGGHIKHRARNSIYRRVRPSTPYTPPHRHVGRNNYASLTNIWFAYDAARKSVVVGPLLITNKHDPPVPERMEFGYSARDVPNPWHRPLSLGQSVPVKAAKHRPRGAKGQWKGWAKHRQFFQTGSRLARQQNVWVLWRKAKTTRQLAHGRRIQEQVWGPPRISYTVAPRPYMQPAMAKSKREIYRRFGNRLRVA